MSYTCSTFLRTITTSQCGSLGSVLFENSLTFDHSSEKSKSHDEQVTGKLTIVLFFIVLVNSLNEKLFKKRKKMEKKVFRILKLIVNSFTECSYYVSSILRNEKVKLKLQWGNK